MEPRPDELVVREIVPADAAAAAGLNEELGYPASTEEVRRRIESLVRLPNQVVYVACLSGHVVGWIDVQEVHHLQSEPRAEIAGLVVSSQTRSTGIGRRLVEQAEKWARNRGLKSVVVRSAIARERAHGFYLREGFTQTKTSAVFTKIFKPGVEP